MGEVMPEILMERASVEPCAGLEDAGGTSC